MVCQFKNVNRNHNAALRRIVASQHHTYKHAMTAFFTQIATPLAEKCGQMMCKESKYLAIQKTVCIGHLVKNMSDLEKYAAH